MSEDERVQVPLDESLRAAAAILRTLEATELVGRYTVGSPSHTIAMIDTLAVAIAFLTARQAKEGKREEVIEGVARTIRESMVVADDLIDFTDQQTR